MALISRIRVVWTGVAGTPAYSNFYFNNSVGNAEDMRTQVLEALAGPITALQAGLKATLDTDVALIDSVTGDIQGVDNVAPAEVNYTGESEPLPPSTQVLLRLKTGVYQGGRQIQGRLFIPYIVSAFNDNGKPAADLLSVVNGVFQAVADNVNVQWVVWSRKTGAIAPVSDAVCWNQFAVMRSRRD